MVAFQNFDIISGFCLDYMHCVLLGVVRNMIDFWCATQNHSQPFYINTQKKKTLDKRLLALKPHLEFSRKPQSLEYRASFKANQLRSLLLYYLPICLNDILKKKYIDHFRLLSFSIYTLSKTEISVSEMNICEKNLNTFVELYQQYYGEKNMTMNVHLLTHIVQCVRKCGPLWAQSAFAFESFNGVLLNYVNGRTDVLCQITSKYIFCRQAPKQSIGINTNNIELLGRSAKLKIDGIEYQNVFKRIRIGRITYTSPHYRRVKKSIDYFVYFKNHEIGAARYYFKHANRIYLSFDKYEKELTFDQFLKIRPVGKVEVAPAEDILYKLIYLELNSNIYVTYTPNNIEKD